MYSYKDRKKAVNLYLKYDKSACSVVRELEYPTFNMLKLWYREYLEEGDLHKESQMQSGYTAEEKKAVIQYYQEHGRSLTRTHNPVTVYNRDQVTRCEPRVPTGSENY